MIDQKLRVLPDEVFDAFSVASLMSGGIGRLRYGAAHANTTAAVRFGGDTPCCIIGHAAFLDGDRSDFVDQKTCEGQIRLQLAPIAVQTNDKAVRAINRSLGRRPSHRVSWEEYCAYLNILPASSVTPPTGQSPFPTEETR